MMVIRILLISAAFVTALLVGYKAGENLAPVDQNPSSQIDEMAIPDVAIPENNQFNLLLIGVDDINKPDANLESIWLAAQVKNSSKITLIPIFPSLDDPALNLLLTESFCLDKGKPGKEFWDAIRSTHIWWKGYLISDLAASVELVDTLGGININNRQMSGNQAVGSITSWKDNAAIAVNHQRIFIESICNQIATNQVSNLKAISNLLDQRFQSNTPTKIFIVEWTTRAASNGMLTCAFPTLTQISFQSSTVSQQISD